MNWLKCHYLCTFPRISFNICLDFEGTLCRLEWSPIGKKFPLYLMWSLPCSCIDGKIKKSKFLLWQKSNTLQSEAKALREKYCLLRQGRQCFLVFPKNVNQRFESLPTAKSDNDTCTSSANPLFFGQTHFFIRIRLNQIHPSNSFNLSRVGMREKLIWRLI